MTGNPQWQLKKAQTHCIHGHEFSVRNTRIRANGTRQCRKCASADNSARQARRRDAGNPYPTAPRPRLTAEQRRGLADQAGLRAPGQLVVECHYCGEPGLALRTERGAVRFLGLETDHVIPLSRGGAHTLNNLVLACGLCNSSKGNRTDWSPYW